MQLSVWSSFECQGVLYRTYGGARHGAAHRSTGQLSPTSRCRSWRSPAAESVVPASRRCTAPRNCSTLGAECEQALSSGGCSSGCSSGCIHCRSAPSAACSQPHSVAGQDAADQSRTSGRTFGKRVGGNPSRVRISYPPQPPEQAQRGAPPMIGGAPRCCPSGRAGAT